MELSSENNKLVYYIQPGEVCTLQFKEIKELPKKKEVGLVDKTGTELGQLRLETQAVSMPQRVGAFLGGNEDERITSSVYPQTQVQNVLSSDAHDSISINADSWE